MTIVTQQSHGSQSGTCFFFFNFRGLRSGQAPPIEPPGLFLYYWSATRLNVSVITNGLVIREVTVGLNLKCLLLDKQDILSISIVFFPPCAVLQQKQCEKIICGQIDGDLQNTYEHVFFGWEMGCSPPWPLELWPQRQDTSDRGGVGGRGLNPSCQWAKLVSNLPIHYIHIYILIYSM